jgi:UDP-N-acetylmuramate dehydrogenase
MASAKKKGKGAAKPAAKKPAAKKVTSAPVKRAKAPPAASKPAAPTAARPLAKPAGARPATAPAPATPVAGAKAARPPKASTKRVPSGPPLPAFPSLPGAVKYEEPLAKHTTFRIGGPARILFTPASAEAVAEAVAWAKAKGVPWMILGLGSNVLIRDGGFPGIVVKIGKGLDQVAAKATVWKVGAGLPTPLLARRTADAGLAGVQRLVGVPGTVGGGVFMNAGAHGQEFATVVQSVTLLTPKGEFEERPRKAVSFSYRRSGLEGHVVLGCTLKLEEQHPDRVKADLAMLLKKRREGTPFDQPCCGSVFKNPDVMTAGRLIEKCGLKGRRVGGAEISAMHANYIVNKGGASADDVLKLIDIARTAVFKEFGLELELEVKVLGGAK